VAKRGSKRTSRRPGKRTSRTAADRAWAKVWTAVETLTQEHPEGTILIGGVAVFLHAAAAGPIFTVEFTHDADMYVDLPSWSAIRNEHDATTNAALSKSQVIIGGIDVDIYVERKNRLRIAYEDLAMGAVDIQGKRVACLEHLLLLKLDAFADRGESKHGLKDQRDIAKLLVLLKNTRPHYVVIQGTQQDIGLLDRVLRSAAFADLAGGNLRTASLLKQQAGVFVERARKALRP